MGLSLAETKKPRYADFCMQACMQILPWKNVWKCSQNVPAARRADRTANAGLRECRALSLFAPFTAAAAAATAEAMHPRRITSSGGRCLKEPFCLGCPMWNTEKHCLGVASVFVLSMQHVVQTSPDLVAAP